MLNNLHFSNFERSSNSFDKNSQLTLQALNIYDLPLFPAGVPVAVPGGGGVVTCRAGVGARGSPRRPPLLDRQSDPDSCGDQIRRRARSDGVNTDTPILSISRGSASQSELHGEKVEVVEGDLDTSGERSCTGQIKSFG